MIRGQSEFEHWSGLSRLYLKSYHLPSPDLGCDVVSMERWLDRCGMTPQQYQKITKTSLQEFIDLNPGWTLFGFIGLALEMVDEKYEHTTIKN